MVQPLSRGARRRPNPDYVCGWHNCGQSLAKEADPAAHFNAHLQQVPSSASRQQLCSWDGCEELLYGYADGEAALRHLLFHAYQARLRAEGALLRQQRGWPACQLDARTRCRIPPLPAAFECAWQNCNHVSHDAGAFYGHVAEHRGLASTGHWPRTCSWEGCAARVPTPTRMGEHLRSHVQEKIVACDNCGLLFASLSKLQCHLERQQDASAGGSSAPKPFSCEHCGKTFRLARLLNDHTRRHVNTLPCDLCEMTCPNASELRRHRLYMHCAVRRHVCTEPGCSYAAKTVEDLTRHEEACHAAALVSRLFCPYPGCAYTTPLRANLLVHLRTRRHAAAAAAAGVPDLRYYLCHVCGVVFLEGKNMSRHLRTIHRMAPAAGHRRFIYTRSEDGFYRLCTTRLELLAVSQAVAERHEQSAAGGVAGTENAQSAASSLREADFDSTSGGGDQSWREQVASTFTLPVKELSPVLQQQQQQYFTYDGDDPVWQSAYNNDVMFQSAVEDMLYSDIATL